MTHPNRGRLTVDTGGNWRLYTNSVPAGMTPVGVVTRDGIEAGALMRVDATGCYVQVNAGAVRTLDGRKVAAALGNAGRPAEMVGGKRVNVYLDQAALDAASRLGEGNVSDGIRRALRMALERTEE